MSELNNLKINVVETRNNISQIIEDVHYNHKSYIITRRGRPFAKIVPINTEKSTNKSQSLYDIALASRSLQKKEIDLQKVMDDIRR
jgi:prevent-host-death family protein